MAPPEGTLVLGMHRSGTSATAGLIRQLGVSFGDPAGLVPGDLDNPAGYHEREQIREINWGILAALGGSWTDPPPLEPGWAARPSLDRFRERASDVIAELAGSSPRGALAAGPQWAIKDPTICLTLPFWLTLTPRVRLVICVRHPAEVASSLVRRYREREPDSPAVRISRGDWMRLWQVYTERALALSRGRSRLVVDHAALMRAPVAERDRLASFLGLPVPVGAQRESIGIRADLHRERDRRFLRVGRAGLRAVYRYHRVAATEARRPGIAAPAVAVPRQACRDGRL